MEKKYPADRFRGKKILAVKYLAKKKSYTEQTIFHGEKCRKKILGCVQTDATTPNIVAPTMLCPFARGVTPLNLSPEVWGKKFLLKLNHTYPYPLSKVNWSAEVLPS